MVTNNDYAVFVEAVRIAKSAMNGFAVHSVEVEALGYVCLVEHNADNVSGLQVKILAPVS
jgi:hypothetical protein